MNRLFLDLVQSFLKITHYLCEYRDVQLISLLLQRELSFELRFRVRLEWLTYEQREQNSFFIVHERILRLCDICLWLRLQFLYQFHVYL